MIGKVTTTKVTKRTVKLELDADDIRNLLTQVGTTVPYEAKVQVRIPSGGDYSGMNLGIGDACPITITWTETDEE